jgi:hypothetical protein
MIELLLSFATSGGLGGLIGLIGSWLTKWEERKTRQLEMGHELAMAEISLREMDKEMEMQAEIAKQAVNKAEVAGWEETQKAGSNFGEAIKAIVRPTITVYLLVLSTWIAWSTFEILGGIEQIGGGEYYLSVARQVVNQCLFLTTVAVTWWFGARPAHKPKG